MNVYQHCTPLFTTDDNTSTYSNEYDPCTDQWMFISDHWPPLHYWQSYLAPPVSSTTGLFTFPRHQTEICPSPPTLPWRDNTVAPRRRYLLQASHFLGLQQNLFGGMTDWLWTSLSLSWRGGSDWNEETRHWGFVVLHVFYFCAFDIIVFIEWIRTFNSSHLQLERKRKLKGTLHSTWESYFQKPTKIPSPGVFNFSAFNRIILGEWLTLNSIQSTVKIKTWLEGKLCLTWAVLVSNAKSWL